MDCIILNMKMFTARQSVTILKDGKAIGVDVQLNDVPNTICALAKEYNISDIKMRGVPAYLENLKHDILTNTNFDNNELNVTIV